MKKLILSTITTSLWAITLIPTAHASNSSEQANLLMAKKPSTVAMVGAAYEGHTTYAEGFLFFNQLIHDSIFYELRAVYIHNYITTGPAKATSPFDVAPTVMDEQNLDGWGVVGILGYKFKLTNKVSLLPALRAQYITNTVSAYQDSFGNKISSGNATYYLGLRLNMKVTEDFSIYGTYYAGYQRSVLNTRGYFNAIQYPGRGQPLINSYVSVLEFGAPYTFGANKSWGVTPYIQLGTTGNNPSFVALHRNISNNGLTSVTPVYAVKVHYNI